LLTILDPTIPFLGDRFFAFATVAADGPHRFTRVKAVAREGLPTSSTQISGNAQFRIFIWQAKLRAPRALTFETSDRGSWPSAVGNETARAARRDVIP
jgi:hypothetical protein